MPLWLQLMAKGIIELRDKKIFSRNEKSKEYYKNIQ
jgi:hypothetical protein